MQAFTAAFAAPIQSERDIVFFDQRGTGLSTPALVCPEYRADYRASLASGVSPPDDGLFRCRDRLLGDGVDLAAYSSAESAADLSDLMSALGYHEWNLYGWSYGTRLALAAMRDKPDGIRSIVLDATLPLQVNVSDEVSANGARAREFLFGQCAADPACNAAYPNLGVTYGGLLERLNRQAVVVHVRDPDSAAVIPVVLNGGRLANVVFLALYHIDLIALLPDAITKLDRGATAAIEAIAQATLLEFDAAVADGTYISVLCNEEWPFDASTRDHDVCKRWGVPAPDPRENEAVSSDLRTLILAGDYDPITPPRWGQLASSTLSRSFFLDFPSLSHGAFVNDDALAGGTPPRSHACVARVLAAFLDNPDEKPDDSCVVELAAPNFAAR